MSRLCSSLSITCWFENSMSIRFFPCCPERTFLIIERSSAASSFGTVPRNWLNCATISLFSFT